ncbi:hypothetical protein PPTS312_06880 [Pseudomonas putida]|uniref:Uncharacterized protein n=1 Tax=Pseudomonas putida TaxID=303 RepID=A0A7U6LYR1_PSEPU|nr:hypothetical protein PPTS312_06880 [Pseudomonas putida]
MGNSAALRVKADIAGAALRLFRDTRPLLQAIAYPCRSGLVPRNGGEAAASYTSVSQAINCLTNPCANGDKP